MSPEIKKNRARSGSHTALFMTPVLACQREKGVSLEEHSGKAKPFQVAAADDG